MAKNKYPGYCQSAERSTAGVSGKEGSCMKVNGWELAFPNSEQFRTMQESKGLTKREWMATQILAGLIAANWSGATKKAVLMADELIAHLNKEPKP